MKRNFSCVLALSALILMCGCKKSINPSSVNLTKPAKADFASNAQWQMPTITGRLIRYDVGDGLNSDCILSYDLGSGVVTLSKFSGSSSTTLSAPSIGFNTDNAGAVYVNTWNTDVTDNYNEVGGVHIIPFDYNGTQHEDHILLYIPGHGLATILHYIPSSNLWHVDWTSDNGSHTSGSGIGGYDLMGKTDKIISYDYGSRVKNYLICYRPGYKFVWVMHSNASSVNPNPASATWTDDIRSSGGIGGFDMSGVNDQLACIGGPSNGNMNVAAYRPGYGYVWFIQHPANSTSFGGTFSTRSGLNGWGTKQQDRLLAISDYTLSPASSVPEDDFAIFCYSPGFGISAAGTYYWFGGVPGGPDSYTFSGTNSAYLLQKNPYLPPSDYEGDHVLCFTGYGGEYNTSLLFYTPGYNRQSQLYYLNTSTYQYSEVY